MIEDDFDRARATAVVAATLCRADRAAAGSLFAAAWKAAQAADSKASEPEEPDGGANSVSTTSGADDAGADEVETSEARDEVILRAAQCDSRLADELAARLRAGAPASDGDAREVDAAASVWGAPSPQARRRLELARSLLATDDESSGAPSLSGRGAGAAALAAPALREGVNAENMILLVRLRRTDASAADDLYGRMLAAELSARGAATGDPNAVSLAAAYLSAPAAPASLAVVDASGGLQLRRTPAPAAPRADSATIPVPAAARDAFARFAASVLLNVDAGSNSGAGDAARRFFALERVLPFFAAERRPELAGLQALRERLALSLDAGRRERLARTADELAREKNRTDDPLRPARERLRRLPEGAARDDERMRLVRAAARHRRWADARRAADEITDADARRRAARLIRTRQIAALAAAYGDAEADDHLRALDFVRASDVPPAWQAWGFAQAAQLARRRGARDAAQSAFAEAVARLAAVRGRDRLAAHALLLLAALEVDPPRAPELLAGLVGEINGSDDLADEITLGDAEADAAANADDATADEVRGGDEQNDAENLLPASARDLGEIFARAAQKDQALALREARNIQAALPRVLAVAGAARATLYSAGNTNGGRRAR